MRTKGAGTNTHYVNLGFKNKNYPFKACLKTKNKVPILNFR
jgi:hypothetical protein